jgi:PPM family protein phosphatase
MKFAAGNAQHVGARPQQQDAFAFSDPKDKQFTEHGGLLGVVADGMGGMARGREASHAAVRSFLESYQDKSPIETIPQALVRSLAAANESVLSLESDRLQENGTGTTLVAAVVHRRALYWISVGDSRVYLLRDNRLTRVTTDHVHAHELNEQVADGKISRAEALQNPERQSLTSYLGMREPSEIDRSLRPIPIDTDDRIILCSDGLYRALSEQEIAAAFRDDLHGACDALIHRALEKQRAQQDNVTVIALGNDEDSFDSMDPYRKPSPRIRSVHMMMAGAVLIFLAVATVWWGRTNNSPPIDTPGENPTSASEAVSPGPGPSAKHESPSPGREAKPNSAQSGKTTPSPGDGGASNLGTSVSAKDAGVAKIVQEHPTSLPNKESIPLGGERNLSVPLNPEVDQQQGAPQTPVPSKFTDSSVPKHSSQSAVQSGIAGRKQAQADQSKDSRESHNVVPATSTTSSQTDGKTSSKQTTKRPNLNGEK